VYDNIDTRQQPTQPPNKKYGSASAESVRSKHKTPETLFGVGHTPKEHMLEWQCGVVWFGVVSFGLDWLGVWFGFVCLGWAWGLV
jgi:hypothetical protein